MKLVYILLLSSIPVLANYCIQAVTLYRFDENRISSRQSDVLTNFNNSRVEERGSYLVLRVGDYSSYSQALEVINGVKKYYSDAYIRKCDFDTSRIIYPKYSTPIEKKLPKYERRDIPPKREMGYEKNYTPIKKHKSQVVKKRKYEQPKPEKAYYTDTLWRDCQKCFAPVYLEEEDDSEPEDDVVQKPKKPIKVKKREEISKKRYKPTPKADDDFWVEAVDKESSTTDSKGSYNPDYYPQIDTDQY